MDGRLRRKVLLTAIALLLPFVSLPFTPASAALPYALKITAPGNGAVINSKTFEISVNYGTTDPDTLINVGMYDSANHRITFDQAAVQAGSTNLDFPADMTGQPNGKWSIETTLESTRDPGYQGGIWRVFNGRQYYTVLTDAVEITFQYSAPPVPQNLPTLTLLQFKEASPAPEYIEIKEGSSATIRWVFKDTTSAALAQETRDGVSPLGGIPVAGEKAVTPKTTTRYTLTGTSDKGTASGSVVVRVVPATPPAASQSQKDLDEIMAMYFKLDLAGSSILSGPGVNPFWLIFGTSGGKVIGSADGVSISVQTVPNTAGGIVCGDYQAGILKWLDLLRWSPKYSHLFNGLDYGPVMYMKGIHNYVVIYPAGSDWKTTGTRLDPWPNQREDPLAGQVIRHDFTLAEPASYSTSYPLCGSPGYPAPAPQARVSVPVRNTQALDIKCPVNVLVTDSTGKKTGMLADGTRLNQISGAGFLTLPEGDGTFEWYFEMPLAGTYNVEITGTADGALNILRGGTNLPVQDYGTRQIGIGEKATLVMDGSKPASPLILPDGSQVVPSPFGANPSPGPKPTIDYALVAGIGAGVLVLLFGAVVMIRRRAARVPVAGQMISPWQTPPAPPVMPAPAPFAPPAGPAGYCRECGQPHAAEARFCGNCSHQFESRPRTAFCPQCGDAVAPDERFCDKCGTRLA
jgi:hypothetical protein